MSRLRQGVFILTLLSLSWIVMTATHELGHIVAAVCSGGTIRSVVLLPFSISTTTVDPNPRPGLVVWSGPLTGSTLPLLLCMCRRRDANRVARVLRFIAGFCLVANGAYIGLGSFAAIGDCREMFNTGTDQWVMVVFGSVAICCGGIIWHRLGSLWEFIRDPALVTDHMLVATCSLLAAAVLIEYAAVELM